MHRPSISRRAPNNSDLNDRNMVAYFSCSWKCGSRQFQGWYMNLARWKTQSAVPFQLSGLLSLSVTFNLMVQNSSKSSSHCIDLLGGTDETGKNICKLSWSWHMTHLLMSLQPELSPISTIICTDKDLFICKECSLYSEQLGELKPTHFATVEEGRQILRVI